MANQESGRFLRGFAIGLGMLFSISLVTLTVPADAACRPTGRIVAGRSLLRCSGPTKCRPTGRYKIVKGVRYQILNCPG
jgi:hypothetical protein